MEIALSRWLTVCQIQGGDPDRTSSSDPKPNDAAPARQGSYTPSAEDLEGGERHGFVDLGGKECQRPPTGPKVLAIADILRSEPYQFQHRRRCASDNAGEVTDVKHRQTHRPRQLFPDDLFLDLKRPLNQTLPTGIDISF